MSMLQVNYRLDFHSRHMCKYNDQRKHWDPENELDNENLATNHPFWNVLLREMTQRID